MEVIFILFISLKAIIIEVSIKEMLVAETAECLDLIGISLDKKKN